MSFPYCCSCYLRFFLSLIFPLFFSVSFFILFLTIFLLLSCHFIVYLIITIYCIFFTIFLLRSYSSFNCFFCNVLYFIYFFTFSLAFHVVSTLLSSSILPFSSLPFNLCYLVIHSSFFYIIISPSHIFLSFSLFYSSFCTSCFNILSFLFNSFLFSTLCLPLHYF